MPILLPSGFRYTATCRGSAPKQVKCEECGAEYVYILTVEATCSASSFLFLGMDSAKQRALASAEKRLETDLEKGCAVAPCPKCGHIQQHMIGVARKQLPARLLRAGIIILLLGLIFVFPAMLSKMDSEKPVPANQKATPNWEWIVVGILVTIGLLLAGVGWLLKRRYNPNDQDLNARLSQARQISLPTEKLADQSQ